MKKIIACLVLFLFGTTDCCAGWSNIQHKVDIGFSSTTLNVYSLSFASAVSSGSVVSGFIIFDNSAPSSLSSIVDDKGNSYAVVDSTSDPGNDETQITFYLANITNAPTTLNFTFNTTTGFIGAALEEDSFGAGVTISLDGHNGAFQSAPSSGANTINSGSATTTTNGDLVKGFVTGTGGNPTYTAGTSPNAFTLRTSSGMNIPGGIVYAILTQDFVQTTAGSIAATAGFAHGQGGDQTVSSMLVFKEVASGGPILRLRSLLGVGQ